MAGLIPWRRQSEDLGFDLPVRVDREARRHQGRAIGRGRVIATKIQVAERVGVVAQQSTANISRFGEQVAMVVPEERARIDTITDTVTIVIAQHVQELAER